MRRKTKLILSGTGLLLGSLILLLVALPLWLPWVLRPLAERLGAGYDEYQRVGYERFRILGLHYTNDSLALRALRIETVVPTAAVWNRTFRKGSPLQIDNWSLQLRSGSDPTKQTTNSPAQTVKEVLGTLRDLDGWLSLTTLSNGVIQFQQQTAGVPVVMWRDETITATTKATLPRFGELSADLFLQRIGTHAMRANLAVPGVDVLIDAAIDVDQVLSIHVTNTWRTNVVLGEAVLVDDWLPSTASLSATALGIPTADTVLADYDPLNVSFAAHWTNGGFDLQLAFAGRSDQTNLPPVSGALVARGDTRSASLQDLHVTSDALRVELSAPVRLNYRGELLSGPARLTFTGDLARLPVQSLGGSVQGSIDLQRSDDHPVEADLRVGLSNLWFRDVVATTATVRSTLRWPTLQVDECSAALETGARVEIVGLADLPARFLSNATVHFAGALPTNWIPAGLQCSNLLLSAEASGPFTNLQHQAELIADSVAIPGLVPLRLEVQERGQHLNASDVRVTATSGQTELNLRGSAAWTPSNTVVSLSALNYLTNDIQLYSLAHPLQIAVTQNFHALTRIQMGGLEWRGPGRALSAEADLEWPLSGRAAITAAGLRTSDFSNWLASPMPASALLHSIHASANWSNGPVFIAGDTRVEIVVSNAPPVQLQFTATNNAEALHVPQVALSLAPLPTNDGAGEMFLFGAGVIPVSASANSNEFSMNVRRDAPLRLDLQTTSNAVISTLLARFTRWQVEAPTLRASINGTMQRPTGMIDLSARSLASLTLTNQTLPEIKDFRAAIGIRPDRIELRQLIVDVGGQALSAEGSVPIAQHGNWKSRVQLEQARGTLLLPSANLSALAPFATNLLAPRGTIDARIEVVPPMKLSGHLAISNASTAPLPTIGRIQDINARVQLHDHSAVIEAVNAQVGGAPLLISGRVDFANWKPATNHWPAIDLRIAGTNLALVRESQKIIRSDLALRVTNTLHQAPAIVGTVNLRDSLYLANLNDLMPSGVTRPSQRPPYFSVEAPLVRDWRLDVQVQGDQFLNVRTPVFRGTITAALALQGSLAEPIALGQVRIGSGTIQFPFVTLSVKQGFITLDSANPYDPALFVSAAGRAYDYDIRLEVTGAASDPRLEFSSIPPLTSEQVLLMATTGEVPRSDYTLSREQRAQKLGVFLGRNVLSQFGLGGGENLTVQSGERVSERGRSTYSVEYKLSENVSLVGEYDRFDEYNAGIQWRVYSK